MDESNFQADDRTLKLVVVTHYFPEHRGGIELVAGALARELTMAGQASIEWFASNSDAFPSIKGVAPHPMPTWNGVEARTGLPYPLWSPSSWRVLWRSIQRCDLVHIHDYVYLGSLLAWGMAKLARRPCVITQHVGNVPLLNRFLRGVLHTANATLGRFILKKTSATIFVSDVVRKQFSLAENGRCRVIANGVDTSIFRPLDVAGRSALKAKLGFGDDRPVLLFVGRFVAKKGLPLLRHLVPCLPQAQWIFAGRGPLDPENWGLSSVRVFHDRSGASLAELYQVADLLVLPSVGEGFPLVVQEAMACGTPALAGNELLGALPEVESVLMTEDVSGAGALERWCSRLTAVLADSEGLRQKRSAVGEFAAAWWAWRRCAGAYLCLYREVRG